MKLWQAKIILTDDQGSDYLVATSVVTATNAEDRRQGLIGMDQFPAGAMLIYPCHAIHMRGVRFPIDVVYTDRKLRVVRVVKHILPGVSDMGHSEAFYTLELPADTIYFNPVQMKIDLGDH